MRLISLCIKLKGEVFKREYFENAIYSELIKNRSSPCKNKQIKVNKNILMLIGINFSHIPNNPKKDTTIKVDIEKSKNEIIAGISQI